MHYRTGLLLMLQLSWVACGPASVSLEDAGAPVGDAGANTADAGPSLEERLALDFVVTPGRFDFLHGVDCARAGNCYGNNPSSPYGLLLTVDAALAEKLYAVRFSWRCAGAPFCVDLTQAAMAAGVWSGDPPTESWSLSPAAQLNVTERAYLATSGTGPSHDQLIPPRDPTSRALLSLT